MDPNVSIRAAQPHELQLLGALKLEASLGWGDFEEELREMPEARELRPEFLDRSIVAETGGVIIGFATLIANDDGEAELEELFVDPHWWRRGVGRELVLEVIKRTRALGSPSLHVVANRKARPFYEALGFVFEGEVMTTLEPAFSMRMPIC